MYKINTATHHNHMYNLFHHVTCTHEKYLNCLFVTCHWKKGPIRQSDRMHEDNNDYYLNNGTSMGMLYVNSFVSRMFTQIANIQLLYFCIHSSPDIHNMWLKGPRSQILIGTCICTFVNITSKEKPAVLYTALYVQIGVWLIITYTQVHVSLHKASHQKWCRHASTTFRKEKNPLI